MLVELIFSSLREWINETAWLSIRECKSETINFGIDSIQLLSIIHQDLYLFNILRYLLKYGNVKRIEKNNSIIYAELPQIPGTLVFYRKISEREENVEK